VPQGIGVTELSVERYPRPDRARVPVPGRHLPAPWRTLSYGLPVEQASILYFVGMAR
jgi:hypothetical protein